MSETEQNQEMLPPPRPLEMDSTVQSTAEIRVPHMPEIQQRPQVLPPQQAMEVSSNHKPTTKLKAPATRANWVNALWADISGQLRRFSVISSDLFDGLLLKKHTFTGSLILSELRKKYEQLGNDRELATVRVLSPEKAMGMWQLLWTVKRHRDPNGRQFHSQTIIDPVNHEAHPELETNPRQIYSVNDFSLPPFIQDFGPGPSEFDPEPEDEFDTIIRNIMTGDMVTGVDEVMWAAE